MSLMNILTALVLFSLPHIARGATCGKTHTVTSGEGCWSIYTDAKLTQAQFLAMNPGLDCNVLALGQNVCVAPTCSKFYTVVSGDSCYQIETNQKISDATFLSLNPGLACGEIFPGQSVCVAAPTTTASATTSTKPATSSLAQTTSAPPASTTVPVTPPSTSISCARVMPVSQGDTCFNLATTYSLQLNQFMALNPGLNCSSLQAGINVCAEVTCGQVYRVQQGDWCAKIETDWQLAAGQLIKLNPGLSCDSLAPGQLVCAEVPVIDSLPSQVTIPTIDRFPGLSAGTAIPQSHILGFAAAEENARSTFFGETAFLSDSQHLAAFAVNDLNGDGKLDQSELQKMMSVDPSVLRGITEINSTLNANNYVTEMLKAADLNRDGGVDKDEFLLAIRQIQNTTNAVTEIGNSGNAVGAPQKRFIWFLIGAIAVILGFNIAITTVIFQKLAENQLIKGTNMLNYLDITQWDTKGSPPSCSAYIYWSNNCGAIGSGHAKSCSNGGERVYGDSCVTHFNSGSAGCGFLGCKSLCYNFNLDNCPCDALKYELERDTEYTDTPASTTNEQGIAACRTKCGNTNGCVGFSASPGSSDKTLSCKVYKTLNNKKSNKDYSTFRLLGSPVGTPENEQCAPLSSEYTAWPASVMADDIAWGKKIGEEDNPSTSGKRATPLSVDRRNDSKYTTSIKQQSGIPCGLCAPFTVTSAVEGTHKVWKNGYTEMRDLSPVWVGRCKGKQSCDVKGGTHQDLLTAVGHEYIFAEQCLGLDTVKSPNCGAKCDDIFLPYITKYTRWSFAKPIDGDLIRKYTGEIKDHIANYGPVLASMCMGSRFTKYQQSLKSTSPDVVYYDDDSQWGKEACGSCNHAVTIVGYFMNRRVYGEKKREKDFTVWIIQNSFGRGYGKSGYQFIEQGSAAMAGNPWYGVRVNEGRTRSET